MKRNFLELRSFLENRNPNLIGYIDGENYPPPLHAQYLASAASGIFFGGIILLMMGDSIFSSIGMPEPEFYTYMKNNKMTTFGILFLINNIGNSMLTTGAFEMSINGTSHYIPVCTPWMFDIYIYMCAWTGDLVFSRLKLGRFPNGQELDDILQRYGI